MAIGNEMEMKRQRPDRKGFEEIKTIIERIAIGISVQSPLGLVPPGVMDFIAFPPLPPLS